MNSCVTVCASLYVDKCICTVLCISVLQSRLVSDKVCLVNMFVQ